MRHILFWLFISAPFPTGFSTTLCAETRNEIIRFDHRKLVFSKDNRFDVIAIKGCDFMNSVGNPRLPVSYISVVIPSDAELTALKVISAKSEKLSGEYYISPAQKPHPISFKPGIDWVEPNYSIYNSASVFPENIISDPKVGILGSYRIVSFAVYPIQYIPLNREVIFYSEVKVEISYERGKYSLPKTTERKAEIFGNMVKDMVINPEQVEHYGASAAKLLRDTVEYLIITADSLANAFKPLADWKTKKGVPAKICSLSYIYANYPGVDNAERIWNFLMDADTSWGTMWVLLGGQCDYENGEEVVPRRDVSYIVTDWFPHYYPDEDTIPSDLYFSAMGSWDDDGDGVWGETPQNGDTVELYSELFVGRAPVITSSQVQTFINKILIYEKTPPLSYLRRMFLPTAILWSTYEERPGQDSIANMTPTDWTDIKLYERNGNLSLPATRDTINNGVGFIHFVGHGNEYGIYYSSGAYLDSWTVDSLTNGDMRSISNAISCFTGAIDQVVGGDCFAEHLILAQGGGVATIMNTRYGWGNPPNLGPSEMVDTSFYHEVFLNNCRHLGVVNAMSKNNYVSNVTWGAYDILPWVLYELTLFGDPELPMWTATPDTFIVTHDSIIPRGTATNFMVNVLNSMGAPIENAYICCMGKIDSNIYQREYTDANGNVLFAINPNIEGDTIFVTVTKQNFLPYEGRVVVKLVGIEANEEGKVVLSITPKIGGKTFTIKYLIPIKSQVRVSIYNLAGVLVREIANDELPAGSYATEWNAERAGIYFCRLSTTTCNKVEKIVKIR
ncbi:MAG: T9SS type A sorting domain-containing protein [Candidatus Stahlbacteria bacterium]|nr:T9SS type A sorting domain-containing protein [Candidatus Stahlbacteria bacterium]